MYLHATVLCAAIKRGNCLARIEQHVRIKGALDSKEHFPLSIGELAAHLIYFFDAHTVLAGDGAAIFNSKFKNICRKLFGSLELTRDVGVK